MQDLISKTVREIAIEMPLSTRVFEEYKIDYCCGGNTPFPDACARANVDPKAVLTKIDALAAKETSEELPALKGSLSELIDYIEDTHHVFLREEIPQLLPLMEKVADRHGAAHPELTELAKVFGELCDDLLPHLMKEENILFPYIKELERASQKGFLPPMSCFGTVQNPVNIMSIEHDNAGEMLRAMRSLTNDYKLPEGACTSYNALFARLVAFELDLHRHIHLENNVLFPSALVLEASVLSLP